LERNVRFTCAVQWANQEINMNKGFFAFVGGLLLGALALSSCDTPTGQGAAAGAGAGAIIGGLAGGGPRSAAIGAAIGAASGALIGHAIQEDRAREYGPPPPGGYPFARPTGRPGMFHSPYTGRVYDLRGVPPGGLTRDVDTGQLFRRP
jgi:Glycine zipper